MKMSEDKKINRKEIIKFVDKKEYENAKSLIAEILDKNSEDFEMQKLMGLCNLNLGLNDDALDNFNQAIKLDSLDASSMYYAASIYTEKEQYKQAESLLNEVIKLREEYIDAYKILAIVYIKTKRFNRVFEIGNKIIQKSVEDAEIYDLMAAAAMEGYDFHLAVDYLKKALSIEHDNPKYITKLGIAYFAAGEITNAIECFRNYNKYQPGDTQTLYYLGLSYYALEEYQTAFEYFKVAYNNNMKDCLSAYAISAYKSGYFSQAVDLYTKLTEQFPDNENYKYDLACCYDGDNKPDIAANIIERLLTFNLNSLQLKLHLASLYSRLGRAEAAKILYADIISNGFSDSNIMYEYAVLAANTNDIDKAEELFKEIIRIDPEFTLAYKDLAVIYTSRRLFDKAEEYFKKAQKIEPDNIYVLFEIANYYNLMADFEKAKKIYNKLLKYENVPSVMRLAVAKNYISMNLPKKAKKILFELFEETPSDTEVLFYLAQALMAEKDYEDAKQLLETAYTICQNVDVGNMLAKVYTELGLYDNAYNLYKKLSTISPSSITLMLAMADCKCRQKDFAKAMHHLKPVLEFFPEHEEAQRLLQIIKKGE